MTDFAGDRVDPPLVVDHYPIRLVGAGVMGHFRSPSGPSSTTSASTTVSSPAWLDPAP
jgi:hypothetical protein